MFINPTNLFIQCSGHDPGRQLLIHLKYETQAGGLDTCSGPRVMAIGSYSKRFHIGRDWLADISKCLKLSIYQSHKGVGWEDQKLVIASISQPRVQEVGVSGSGEWFPPPLPSDGGAKGAQGTPPP